MAKEWNLTPSQFWNSSKIDKIFMIAHYEVNAEMQAFEMSRKSD